MRHQRGGGGPTKLSWSFRQTSWTQLPCDRELHGLRAYNNLACDRDPDKITLQRVHRREFDDRRLLLLCDDLNETEQKAWRESLPIASRMDISDETLGEFLVEEAIQCVRRFDALSTSTGALRKGKKLPPPKPIEYPPRPTPAP